MHLNRVRCTFLHDFARVLRAFRVQIGPSTSSQRARLPQSGVIWITAQNADQICRILNADQIGRISLPSQNDPPNGSFQRCTTNEGISLATVNDQSWTRQFWSYRPTGPHLAVSHLDRMGGRCRKHLRNGARLFRQRHAQRGCDRAGAQHGDYATRRTPTPEEITLSRFCR